MTQFCWARFRQPGTRQSGAAAGRRPSVSASPAGRPARRLAEGPAVERGQGRHHPGPDPHHPFSSPENESDCSGPAFGAAVGPTFRARPTAPGAGFRACLRARGALSPVAGSCRPRSWSTAGPPCSFVGWWLARLAPQRRWWGQPDQRGPRMRSSALCRSSQHRGHRVRSARGKPRPELGTCEVAVAAGPAAR